MHEASLMRDLMRKVLDVARERGAARVVALRVRLGALSHFSASHFAEHFEHSARGTIAEGARLEAIEDTDIACAGAADVVLESIEVA